MKWKAVLFDFDGVLGKTMEDNFLSWKEALGTENISVDERTFFAMEGTRPMDLASHYLKVSGKPLEHAEKLVALKEELYRKNAHFSFYPGALDVVHGCRRLGLKLALVSGGSSKRLINAQTESFLKNFDTVITAEDVGKGKPDPEPYLKAASRLGVAATQCLVVENAPLGLESARRAGMDSVAIASTLGHDQLMAAGTVFTSISEVLPYLGGAGASS